MPDKGREKSSIYTRRGFLKTAALASGALLAAPLLSNPAGAAASSLTAKDGAESSGDGVPIRLGVLLPESNIYPELGTNFLAGMRAYLGLGSDSRATRGVTIIPEITGFGPQRMLQKAEKLLRIDGANLLIGLTTPSVAAALSGLLVANRTLLLAANMGENVARQNEQHPYIFHHTLASWQSNYALGEWAAGKLGRRAFIAASFYDSGYDSLYAFRTGFEHGGGAVAETYVTGLPGDPPGMDALVKAMVKARPDVVYAAFCGQSATDFVAAYARSGLSGRVPLVGSAFLVDESVLPARGAAALGVRTAFGSPAADSPESQTFLAAYRSESKQAPDAFALLGYETAQLITDALNAAGKNALQAESLKGALSTARFTGPRGLVTMDAAQSTVGGQIYLREVQRQGGALRNVAVARLDSLSEKAARVGALRNDPKTGWLNAYLSV